MLSSVQIVDDQLDHLEEVIQERVADVVDKPKVTNVKVGDGRGVMRCILVVERYELLEWHCTVLTSAVEYDTTLDPSVAISIPIMDISSRVMLLFS